MASVLSAHLEEATQSLIEHLRASEIFIRYQKTSARMNEDQEAQDLLEQLTKSQSHMRQKQSRGEVNQTEVDALRLLQERVQRNSIIMDYAQAQQEVINFLQEMNGEMSKLLGINFASFANHSTC
jgi:cell fate (sporulation/competence/biofilm development) regulator YlbF (YheA/YmcA/DUF963 family)